MSTPVSRARMIGTTVLAVVFAAGITTGVALDRLMRPAPRIRSAFATDMSPVLDRLQLTPEQRTKAEAMIQRRAPRAEAAMLETSDRLRVIADSLDADLRSILTSDQRVRLDSLRSGRTLMLKRKVVGPDGASVTDTVFQQVDPSRP